MLDEENKSGTLEEAVELFILVKPRRSRQTVKALAERAVREALLNGVTFIRAQTDVNSIAGMKHLEAVLELRDAYRGVVDIQVVACMEYPLAAEPEAAAWLGRAVEAGADLIGGIPEVEPDPELQTPPSGACLRRRRTVWGGCRLPHRRDSRSDLPHPRAARRFGCSTKLSGTRDGGSLLRPLRLRYRICPKSDRKGRLGGHPHHHKPAHQPLYPGTQPRNAHLPRNHSLKELLAAGVNVSCGLDDNSNFFLPFGKMNMLEVALFTALGAQMTSPDQLQTIFDMPRRYAARILGLQDYGFGVGKSADFIILPVETVLDAVRLAPAPRFVVRRGQIVAESRVEQVAWTPA